jgi:hypothetical protein
MRLNTCWHQVPDLSIFEPDPNCLTNVTIEPLYFPQRQCNRLPSIFSCLGLFGTLELLALSTMLVRFIKLFDCKGV